MNKGILPILAGIIAVMLSSCTPGRDYAAVKSNLEVERIFKTEKLLPQYKYYFNGPESIPRALLALDRNYILKSQFWHEFDSNEQMQKWIRHFDQTYGELDDIEYVKVDYRGIDILGTDRQRIGMVYTRFHWVVAWSGEENSVYVLQPEPSGTQRSMFRRYRRHSD